jgi:hypothetical protein
MREPIQPTPIPATPPKKPWYSSYWLRVPVAAVVAGYCIYSLGDNLAAAGGKLELPKCDSAKAEEMVKAAVKNGPMSKILNVEILALKDIQTQSSSEERVICLARGITNGGESKFAFSFEWVNKAEGQFVTQVAEAPTW